MSSLRSKRFWIWTAGVAGLIVVSLVVAGIILSRKFEPYIREQTVLYLEKRFESKAELKSLKVSMPMKSPLQVLLNKGRGAKVRVEGVGISLRHHGRTDVPPMFSMDGFHFEIDLPTIWERPARVPIVRLNGLSLNIPPKGDRPSLTGGMEEQDADQGGMRSDPKPPSGTPSVIIDEILADGARLAMMPRDPAKAPLVFEIRKLRLTSAGPQVAMRYDAEVVNAKPPGLVKAQGSFGPWASGEPSLSPLSGDYTFHDADLGVFKGIAGTLSSKGSFRGLLGGFVVDGVTETPNFRLTSSGNPVPLKTEFHAIVDGTNGNTLLQPVIATLGSTRFHCQGGVVRGKDDAGKTVVLDVVMQQGRIDDLLRLAMKGGKSFLRGGVGLKMKFELPPGKGEIADRLNISGDFSLNDARFTSRTVQDKIDSFSRAGQGRPKDEAIDEVPSNIEGTFKLAGGVIRFSSLQFTTPGAEVALRGRFRFSDESLAFRGKLRLDAKVSQTQSGWKRYVLKPVDPFFSKEGAGTLVAIQISGSRNDPQFGLDRGLPID